MEKIKTEQQGKPELREIKEGKESAHRGKYIQQNVNWLRSLERNYSFKLEEPLEELPHQVPARTYRTLLEDPLEELPLQGPAIPDRSVLEDPL